VTCSNFVKLAQEGFYDGLTFHRIIEGFVMQGGCPQGTGRGGSGQKILGEFKLNGVKNELSHTRGAISMARSEQYNSASSQFFIVHDDDARSSLDRQYAAFGYVTAGIEIVDAICESAKPTDDNGSIAKKEQPIIKTVSIRIA
jgi:peptidyl-prolyl cis-trans isomerase B (cyclophilin B)